ERVQQHQSQAPEFSGHHAADQQTNRQRRKHRQQSVERQDRLGRELPQHDIGSPQISQEQQTQGSFAPLPADAIRGQNQSGQHDTNEARQRQRLQQRMAERGRRFPIRPNQQPPKTDGDRRRARNQANVIGAAP